MTGSGPQAAQGRLWKACAEALLETLQRIGEALEAQVHAGLEAIEGGVRVTIARDVAEFCVRLADYWQKSLECLRPMTMLPVQGVTFVTAWERYMASGMRTITESVYQQRLAVCRTCEFFRDNQCLKCGCRLAGDVIAKARWASESCPEGRWPQQS
jgi:hypothetical protein